MKPNFKIISKKSITLSFLILLTPFYSSAEAGKGISDGSIILALSALVVLVLNQVFLTITSFNKIMKPEVKSSILHYISFFISIIILFIYFPNKKSVSLPLFEAFITVPFILGIISFTIAIFNWVRKKNS